MVNVYGFTALITTHKMKKESSTLVHSKIFATITAFSFFCMAHNYLPLYLILAF
jgi:hypothetical protein